MDLDEESYYLDGKYWTSWEHYGEEMAEEINKLLNKQDKIIEAKTQQLENVKDVLNYHKKVISHLEIGLCTTEKLRLIEEILNELGWNSNE